VHVLDQSAEMEFVVQLGAALIQAGTAVDDVHKTVIAAAEHQGIRDASVVVLPTVVLLQGGGTTGGPSRMTSFRRVGMRLDQISSLDELTRHAERGHVTAADGLRRLRDIRRARPPRRRIVRVLGMGVLSTGFALLLQPTPSGIGLAFVLGLAIGVLRIIELPRFQVVLPVIATFGVSIAVFWFAGHYDAENPIRMLIPPLVLFLPGAALTTGTMELAAGDTVSGASRLVEGVVNLLLLAFGIVAAAQVVHVPQSELIDNPIESLGWLTPIIGLVVLTAGHYLHNCAPRRTVGWIFLVCAAAFAGQAAGAAVVSPELSAFFGAIVMTPLILWLSGRPDGPPRMTLFLPAFWMLVPGATGLIGVTQAVGVTGVGVGDFGDTAVTVASITLGTLLGAATWNASTDVAAYALETLVGRSPDSTDG
jgi:uncharacterized membrane protein YjjP (DUF1212 family)